MTVSHSSLVCEIHAHRSAHAAALAEIAATCAQDVGLPLSVKAVRIGVMPNVLRPGESVLTLHLPADLAAAQHPVWCLACRLACFCPQSRVSVLVQGAEAFSELSPRARRGHVA